METHKPSVVDRQSSDPPARKPYEAPRLQVYGDLVEITGGTGTGTKNDGSGHPNMHLTT